MMCNLMLTIMLFLALAMAVAAVSEDVAEFDSGWLLQDSSGSLSEEVPEETSATTQYVRFANHICDLSMLLVLGA